MVVKIEGKELVIRAPIAELTPSKSGKSLTVYTSNGNRPTDAKINGKAVVVGLNAYIPVGK